MTGVITTGNIAKALRPGVKSWWGIFYKNHPDEYVKLFDERNSDKSFEEDVQVTGMGLAAAKPQGSSIQYDSIEQGFVNRSTHVTYGKGFIITEEAIEDNQYMELAERKTKAIARSMKLTKENVAANIYNRAFNSSFTYADGKELVATDHPTKAGDQANTLAVAADMSEASIEDLVNLIGKFKDDRGLNIQAQAKRLIVPTDLQFESHRILKSTLQSGTGNNDINALNYLGIIPEICVNHYLLDPGAFFIRTDQEGLIYYNRRPISFVQDNDFDTSNLKYKATERYSFTASDWRAMAASQGA